MYRDRASLAPRGDEEEAVVAVEAAFSHDAVPVGMPHAELAEGLMAGDHGGADGPTGSLAEEAREDVEEQPADVGEEVPVVTEEDALDLGNGPDEP
jgi:hypothetical protein